MKSSMLRAVLGFSATAAAVLITSHAQAGVTNPDYYFIDISDSGIKKVGGVGRMPNISGQLEGDIASDGSFAYNGSSFTTAATSLAGISATWIVGVSGTSGTVDPATQVVSLTLRMRIKYTGGTVGTSCQTAQFTVTASTAKTSTEFGTLGFSSLVGTFQAVAEDFVIPQVTAAACGGTTNANNINTTFNLGAASGGVAMFVAGSITNPQIPQ